MTIGEYFITGCCGKNDIEPEIKFSVNNGELERGNTEWNSNNIDSLSSEPKARVKRKFEGYMYRQGKRPRLDIDREKRHLERGVGGYIEPTDDLKIEQICTKFSEITFEDTINVKHESLEMTKHGSETVTLDLDLEDLGVVELDHAAGGGVLLPQIEQVQTGLTSFYQQK